MKRNILIFHSGALGDFILTWPLATALGRMFAQSRIIYVTAASKGDLARQVLGVEAIDSENGWHVLFADGADPQPPQFKWLDGASLIFSFVSKPGDTWHGNVQRLAPAARIICLQPRAGTDYPSHAAQFVTDQLADLAPIQQGVQQIVSSLSQRPIKSMNIQPQRIIIHPGAGAPEKCWSAEKYLELIDLLKQAGKCVRVLLGEAEHDRWSEDQTCQFESAAETVWPSTYLGLLIELRSASAFIGNDSGPSHLAAIIGIPTLAIFQSTNPALWRPMGPTVRVATGKSSPSEIIATLSELEKKKKPEPRMDTNEQE